CGRGGGPPSGRGGARGKGPCRWNALMSDRTELPFLADTLKRIAAALERLAPRAPAAPDLAAADAFVWHPEGQRLTPVPHVNRVDMSLLKGVDRVRDMLLHNTAPFARG